MTCLFVYEKATICPWQPSAYPVAEDTRKIEAIMSALCTFRNSQITVL